MRRGRRQRRASASATRGLAIDGYRLARRSGQPWRARTRIDVFVELIGGGEDGAAHASVQGRARNRARAWSRQTRRCSRSTACARQARRGARRAALVRSGRRRRHPDHQDAARGARRQQAHAHLRDPERHLQLHPDPDGGGRDLCRGAQGGAGARLRRGRSDLRRRGPRRRAEARDPDQRRLRHRDRRRPQSSSRASLRSSRTTSRRPTNSATASSCSASRSAPIPASSSACIRPWCHATATSRAISGVTNAVAVEGDFIGPVMLSGPGAGRRRHGLGGRGRHRRPRARRCACRRSAGRRRASSPTGGAHSARTRAATTSASRSTTAGRLCRDRPAHGRGRHLAGLDPAAEPADRQRAEAEHRGGAAGHDHHAFDHRARDARGRSPLSKRRARSSDGRR